MMGDSAMEEDRILELLGEPGLEPCFDEEESEEMQLECTCMEKEKGKMVYVIDGEEMESLDVNHTEGMHKVIDSADEKACAYHEPLKIKKVNIGSETEPKEATIGDYWSEKEVSKIIDLLCEFQDLFPCGYHELKGIHHSLGEMKIKLKEGAHLIWKRPYRMNLNLHVKVKEEIDKMITSGIIEAVEESEW
ncbi:hypothetical protein KI387_041999, partial [Taxus chinensis]